MVSNLSTSGTHWELTLRATVAIKWHGIRNHRGTVLWDNTIRVCSTEAPDDGEETDLLKRWGRCRYPYTQYLPSKEESEVLNNTKSFINYWFGGFSSNGDFHMHLEDTVVSLPTFHPKHQHTKQLDYQHSLHFSFKHRGMLFIFLWHA